ncbi:MAG TPA: transcriptional regulator [Acidimicrobiia bacterium]|nr:transcriptional regulator [Acidimicrobiia bacterium]
MAELDPLIHAPKRLGVMSVLAATDGAEFAFLQERLDLTAPDLSKQMRALADAGYVSVRKTGRGAGSATWYRMTRQGRSAFEGHVQALRDLIDDLPQRAS